MDTNKMRSAFEAEILADRKSIRRCEDSYHFGTVHRKWLFWQKAWQASREAVVVDLPKPHYEFEGDEAPEMFASEVVAAIEAQGLKVAP